MALVPGTRLGPYEVVAPLGAGGMGEVYRARDTRLDRTVAIKLLPPRVAHDPERRARFEREAKTISSLNHPHICTLFDVGEEQGSHYLVMELLEGESLADRLQRGPLPLDQVVKYGAQVADALDCAHKQGIVHRDLKPGNVVLTRSGAKLLDFGLARSTAEASLLPGPEDQATEAKPLTAAGTVLGTYQYMAPEQLAGAEAGPRTDIFALGTVLYEMATGRRAFEGKSKTSLVAAILSAQPAPISSLQADVPQALDHVVRKCLEKEPDDRWQSAHDVARPPDAGQGESTDALRRVPRPMPDGPPHGTPSVRPRSSRGDDRPDHDGAQVEGPPAAPSRGALPRRGHDQLPLGSFRRGSFVHLRGGSADGAVRAQGRAFHAAAPRARGHRVQRGAPLRVDDSHPRARCLGALGRVHGGEARRSAHDKAPPEGRHRRLAW